MGQAAGRHVWVVGAVVAAATMYVVVAWHLTQPGTFWSVDNGLRFVQLQSLRLQGYRTLAAYYPAGDLDPDRKFYPIAEGFAYHRTGRTYLSIPWLFPLVSAPLYGWLGQVGLVVIPALCALLAAYLVGAAGAREAPGAGAAACLLVAVASPLLVYGAVLWDHAPLVALAAGAVFLLLPQEYAGRVERTVWAGFLLGAGAWLRNEAYPFAAAVLVGLWASGRASKVPQVAAGMAIPLLPLWAYNQWWFGHPLGNKAVSVLQTAASPGLIGYLHVRVLVAYDALLSVEHYTRAFLPERVPEAGLVAASIMAGAALLRAGLVRESPSWAAAGGLLLAGVGLGLFLARLPVMGLLPSAPFVALAWVRKPRDATDRFLWIVAGLYTAGVLAVSSVGGLQWGPRYLLPVIPVLGILCARSVACARGQRARLGCVLVGIIAALVVSGLALQLLGVRFIRHSLDTLRAMEDALRSTRYAVLASGFEPAFRSMGRLYFDKKLMVVDSQLELRELVTLLASQRVEGWSYVPRYPQAFEARVVERWTDGGHWRFRVEDDRTLMVVEFGGPWPVRVVTYRGRPGD